MNAWGVLFGFCAVTSLTMPYALIRVIGLAIEFGINPKRDKDNWITIAMIVGFTAFTGLSIWGLMEAIKHLIK